MFPRFKYIYGSGKFQKYFWLSPLAQVFFSHFVPSGNYTPVRPKFLYKSTFICSLLKFYTYYFVISCCCTAVYLHQCMFYWRIIMLVSITRKNFKKLKDCMAIFMQFSTRLQKSCTAYSNNTVAFAGNFNYCFYN